MLEKLTNAFSDVVRTVTGKAKISEKNIEIAFFLFKIVFLPICSDYLSLPTKEFSSIVCVQRKTRNGYDIPSIENSLALARD